MITPLPHMPNHIEHYYQEEEHEVAQVFDENNCTTYKITTLESELNLDDADPNNCQFEIGDVLFLNDQRISIEQPLLLANTYARYMLCYMHCYSQSFSLLNCI